MTLVKCPRCELNYMNEGDKMCSVCRKELRGSPEQYDVIELCSECGENPVVPGQELCAYCLKELARRNAAAPDEVIVPDPNIEIDSVSTMDEIDLDLDGDLDETVFEGEDDAFEEDEAVPFEEGADGDEEDFIEDED